VNRAWLMTEGIGGSPAESSPVVDFAEDSMASTKAIYDEGTTLAYEHQAFIYEGPMINQLRMATRGSP
jgi:hypothetical protein